jgi:hypothetical protein
MNAEKEFTHQRLGVKESLAPQQADSGRDTSFHASWQDARRSRSCLSLPTNFSKKMNNIPQLRAAAVVLWLLLTSTAGLHAQSDPCGRPILPQDLAIKVIPSAQEPGVYAFVPLCDGDTCERARYLFQWRFADKDYSVQQLPSRAFTTYDLQNVRLVLTGIKETDELRMSQYSGCPPEVIRNGGCTSTIPPHCPRQTKVATTSFTSQAAPATRRHEEFGKLLALQKGDYRMLIATHDGSPVPLQTSQYPLVLENRSSCTAKVTTEIKANVSHMRANPDLRVVEGGKSVQLGHKGGKISVETTLAPYSTAVMLIEVSLTESMGMEVIGQTLELDAESHFVPVGVACKSDRVKAKLNDQIQRAVDPSYLKLLTRHRLTWGDKVRYKMLITNEGSENSGAISIVHELEPVWNRASLKYTCFKIDGHRLKKEKHGDHPEAGEYYFHDQRYSDSAAVVVIHPTEKYPLKKGAVMEIKLRVRLDKQAPDGWDGNTPPKGVHLKPNQRYIHHAYWSFFANEGVWYQSNSAPPTILHKKGLKGWRFARTGLVVGAGVSVAAYRRQLWQLAQPVLKGLRDDIQQMFK